MIQIVMGISGASGAPYAQRLAQLLVERDVHLHLVVSPMARRVMADEIGLRKLTIENLIGRPVENATLYSHNDLGARIASGSFLTHGMVICPCSSHSLAAVANGLGDNLITRAAMVTLKESRRLVLVPREMPLSQVEIANMLQLAQSGVVICPASPGFYMQPQKVQDLVDFVAGRVLDLFGLPHELNTRWDPKASRPPTDSGWGE